MHAPTETVLRAAARHVHRRAEVVLRDVPYRTTEVSYSDGGTVTLDDVRHALTGRLGPLIALWFCRTCATNPHAVMWEGLDAHGGSISGRALLHAGIAVDRVVSWVEVLVDEPAAKADPRARLAGVGVGVPHNEGQGAEGLVVVLADGGVISTSDVARLLGARVGPLEEVRFTLGLGGAVRWKAQDGRGEIVSGWVVLHAGVRDRQVVVWGEIVVDERGVVTGRRAQVVSARGAELRLDEIARRGRGLVRDLRELRLALPEVVARVVGLVDLAEGGDAAAFPEVPRNRTAAGYDRRAVLEEADHEGEIRVLERRLEGIAQQARDLLVRTKAEPSFSHTDLLKGIARIVALAEREPAAR